MVASKMVFCAQTLQSTAAAVCLLGRSLQRAQAVQLLLRAKPELPILAFSGMTPKNRRNRAGLGEIAGPAHRGNEQYENGR